jgi:NAD(P)-dependent dehydrogenase (short-subunit alcohol dehydrogenase family)
MTHEFSFPRLADKVALVTGATGGLGRVIVRRLVEQGARVAAVYRDEAKFLSLLAEISPPADAVAGFAADVTVEAGVIDLVQNVMARFGRIDIALAVAGAYRGGTDIAGAGTADWDSLMSLNLRAVFLCLKSILPHMVRQNYGRIVAVSARQAVDRKARAKSGAYSVSKAGLIVLIETIAEEFKKYDITANCLLPGTIDTPANRAALSGADASKWVPPEDVAEAVLFLASEDSRAVNGAAIPVFGKS